MCLKSLTGSFLSDFSKFGWWTHIKRVIMSIGRLQSMKKLFQSSSCWVIKVFDKFWGNPCVQSFFFVWRTNRHKDFGRNWKIGEIHFFWHKILMIFEDISAKLYIDSYWKKLKVFCLHFWCLKVYVYYKDTWKSLKLTIIMNFEILFFWQPHVPGSLNTVITINLINWIVLISLESCVYSRTSH